VISGGREHGELASACGRSGSWRSQWVGRSRWWPASRWLRSPVPCSQSRHRVSPDRGARGQRTVTQMPLSPRRCSLGRSVPPAGPRNWERQGSVHRPSFLEIRSPGTARTTARPIVPLCRRRGHVHVGRRLKDRPPVDARASRDVPSGARSGLTPFGSLRWRTAEGEANGPGVGRTKGRSTWAWVGVRLADRLRVFTAPLRLSAWFHSRGA
jgi:hypothetical protein